MGPTSPPSLPPVTAEYTSTFQQTGSESPGTQSSHCFSRAADGKTRVDSGNTSVISNPAAGQTIVLNHLMQTATIQPSLPNPSPSPPKVDLPKMPSFSPPSLPGQPQAPGVKVEDLGKTLIQGHEVEGKRFVTPPPPPGSPFPMPAVPKMSPMPGMPPAPAAPHMPGMPPAPTAPQMPGMPPAPAALKMPGMPPAPAAPQIPGTPPASPTTTEVWTSTSMGVPMLAKLSGSFGQLTQACHKAVPGEPHPSAFQIPPGYKVL